MKINPTKRIERRFVNTMNRLVRALFKEISSARTPQEAIKNLEWYANSQQFKDWCDKLATSVTTQVHTIVNGTWREAAAKAGRGSRIYEYILRDLKSPLGGDVFLKIQENAALIKTFPRDISADLNAYIAKEGLKGRRSTDILTDLMARFPNTAQSRLKLIARTEVSKTQTALIQSRAVALGADWYIWRISDDERVRDSHRKMDGVICNWKNPPDPEKLIGAKSYGKYHAGDIFNCRCYPEPIVNLDYVKFPAKVYINGSIRSMSRKQFENIAA